MKELILEVKFDDDPLIHLQKIHRPDKIQYSWVI